LRKFDSAKEPIRIEHILASAAVPNLFPAVQLDGDALWDSLFSDNPLVAGRSMIGGADGAVSQDDSGSRIGGRRSWTAH
jgi:NTE family protein